MSACSLACSNQLTPKSCCVCMQVFQSISKEMMFASDAPVTFKGVQFEVPKDTDMLFSAPAFTFEKGQVSVKSQVASINHGRRYYISRCCFCLRRLSHYRYYRRRYCTVVVLLGDAALNTLRNIDNKLGGLRAYLR